MHTIEIRPMYTGNFASPSTQGTDDNDITRTPGFKHQTEQQYLCSQPDNFRIFRKDAHERHTENDNDHVNDNSSQKRPLDTCQIHVYTHHPCAEHRQACPQ